MLLFLFRYYQTSILFPILRSYNKTSSMFTRQAPFTWGSDNKLIQGIKEIVNLRYSLLKWYYGLFIRNNGTGTVNFFKIIFFYTF